MPKLRTETFHIISARINQQIHYISISILVILCMVRITLKHRTSLQLMFIWNLLPIIDEISHSPKFYPREC